MPIKEVLLMNRSVRRSARLVLIAAVCLILLLASAVPVAAEATDEILDFTITVDVNEDASLDMTYHIDWLVLDDSIGELEWIDLGVPNQYHTDITPLTDTTSPSFFSTVTLHSALYPP